MVRLGLEPKGRQDGRCRRVHWAITTPPLFIFQPSSLICKNGFLARSEPKSRLFLSLSLSLAHDGDFDESEREGDRELENVRKRERAENVRKREREREICAKPFYSEGLVTSQSPVGKDHQRQRRRQDRTSFDRRLTRNWKVAETTFAGRCLYNEALFWTWLLKVTLAKKKASTKSNLLD